MVHFYFYFWIKIHHANQQIVYSFLFLLDSLQIKWLPVHTLAASGEFYLMDALLKHNVDINAVDVVGGMTLLDSASLIKFYTLASLYFILDAKMLGIAQF